MKKYLFFTLAILSSMLILFVVIGGTNLKKAPYEKINLKDYEDFINAKKSFVVYIHKTNCVACQQIKPIVFKLIEENNLEVSAINLDDRENFDASLLKKYKIDKTPTFIYYDTGMEKKRLEGINSSEAIYELLKLGGKRNETF